VNFTSAQAEELAVRQLALTRQRAALERVCRADRPRVRDGQRGLRPGGDRGEGAARPRDLLLQRLAAGERERPLAGLEGSQPLRVVRSELGVRPALPGAAARLGEVVEDDGLQAEVRGRDRRGLAGAGERGGPDGPDPLAVE
jgi:hypothetical protein